MQKEMRLSEMTISYRYKRGVKELVEFERSEDAINYCYALFDQATIQHVESAYVVALSKANKVIGWKKLGDGGLDGVMMDLRVVMQFALLNNASYIVLCHNHPSGNNKPSSGDKSISSSIKEAGILHYIKLLDHIIIVKDKQKCLSMADEGLL